MLRPEKNHVGEKEKVNINQYLLTPDGNVSHLRGEENDKSEENDWIVHR